MDMATKAKGKPRVGTAPKRRYPDLHDHLKTLAKEGLLVTVDRVIDKDKKLIGQLSVEKARDLITDGTISGGMIPKIETCLDAISGGVEAAVIIDGRVPNAILLELFAEGAGTLIRRGR